jgi:hypothetical protein
MDAADYLDATRRSAANGDVAGLGEDLQIGCPTYLEGLLKMSLFRRQRPGRNQQGHDQD